MLKKGLLIIFTIFLSLIGASNVDAASISISSSKNSVIVGNTITVTVTISGGGVIGQAYGTVNASPNLTLLAGSSGTSINYFNGTNEQTKNLTYTYKYKANSSGSATITVTGVEVGNLETGAFETAATATKTITITKASSSGGSSGGGGTTSQKKEYSSNNNLKSLEIEGYKIEPNFNKDTLEYKLTVDQSVEKIKINAKAEDNKASVAGTGEINLSAGENTHEVRVTAENGNEKKYKIIISVEDLNPIKVKINKEEYTVVKKNNDLIEKLEYYEETNIKIDDQDVVAYKNDKTKTTLVLLKDKDNNIKYYIYDEKTKKYEPYKYIKVNNVILQLLEPQEKLKKYKEYKTTIGETVLKIFKLEKGEKLGLVYGRNIATNNISFYQYDELENTLSRYYRKEIDFYKLETEKLKKYLNLGICITSGLFVVIILVSIINSNKKKKLR